MAGGVFLSYRREESAPQAGRLYDHLSARFGESRVFMDVDSIGLGLDFAEVIEDAVSSCEVLLALIGPGWLAAADANGRRRLDSTTDYVRLEIQAALERRIRVVPVLLNGAELPEAGELPPELEPLTRRQALELDDASFRTKVARLVDQLEAVIPAPTPVAENGNAWGAELVDRSEKHRLLELKLGEESRRLRIDVLFGGVSAAVEMDGQRVSKETIGDPHEFTISDGGRSRPVRVELKRTFWANELVLKSVEVDSRVLYRE